MRCKKEEMRKGKSTKANTEKIKIQRKRQIAFLSVAVVGVVGICISFINCLPDYLHEVLLSVGSGLLSSVPIALFIEHIERTKERDQEISRAKDLEYDVYSSMQSLLYEIVKIYPNSSSHNCLPLKTVLEEMKKEEIPGNKNLENEYSIFISSFEKKAKYVANSEDRYPTEVVSAFEQLGDPEQGTTAKEIIEHIYTIVSKATEIKNFSIFREQKVFFLKDKVLISAHSPYREDNIEKLKRNKRKTIL